jgi:hypothetical protein
MLRARQLALLPTDWHAKALLTPPIFLARAAYTRSFSLRRLLRNTAFNTFTYAFVLACRRFNLTAYSVGPALGFGLGWLRMRNMADEGIEDRAYRLRNKCVLRLHHLGMF